MEIFAMLHMKTRGARLGQGMILNGTEYKTLVVLIALCNVFIFNSAPPHRTPPISSYSKTVYAAKITNWCLKLSKNPHCTREVDN